MYDLDAITRRILDTPDERTDWIRDKALERQEQPRKSAASRLRRALGRAA